MATGKYYNFKVDIKHPFLGQQKSSTECVTDLD